MKLYQPPPKKLRNLAISSIRLDGGTQLRLGLNTDTVAEYKEAIENGAQFPPVVVFSDPPDLWLSSGFHRIEAHQQAKRKYILAEIVEGTLREAILFSAATNKDHGLRRNRADRRRVVETLVRDTEWGKWGNKKIADHCGVSPFLVYTVRKELEDETRKGASYFKNRMRVKVSRGGVEYEMDTSDMGRKKLSEMSAAEQIEAINAAEARPDPVGECPSCGHRAALCDFAI